MLRYSHSLIIVHEGAVTVYKSCPRYQLPLQPSSCVHGKVLVILAFITYCEKLESNASLPILMHSVLALIVAFHVGSAKNGYLALASFLTEGQSFQQRQLSQDHLLSFRACESSGTASPPCSVLATMSALRTHRANCRPSKHIHRCFLSVSRLP